MTDVPAEDGQELKFTVEVDVRPELELPDYVSGITVEVDDVDGEATDEDVEERLTDAAPALRHPQRRRARRRDR